MQLWGGRFNKSTDKLVQMFNSSLEFDKRLYEEDIIFYNNTTPCLRWP